jgi:Flp pilus assembly protein TadG
VKPVNDSWLPNAIRDKEKGVAAVELAIILPLFCILLLGILEIGGMARDHQALQNGAREGARFSAMPANRMSGVTNPTVVEDTIKNRVIAYLANESITVSSSDIVVSQTYPIALGSMTVNGSQITITYSRPILFSGISRWIPLSTTLQGKAVFRNFY